jgi:protein-disulfide isomerase
LLTNNANFSFIEFSDLECPYCAKLHTDWIIEKIKNQYWVLIDYRVINFPLPNHANAQLAAEVNECLWLQKWASTFYRFIEETFSSWKTDKESLINRAAAMWADREKLNKCVDEWTFRDFVQYQKLLWEKMLWITSTPSVIIRNNNSWKYVMLSWLHSLEDYQKALESLYK